MSLVELNICRVARGNPKEVSISPASLKLIVRIVRYYEDIRWSIRI